MLFALADAVVLTLPEAEPLAVPAPSLTPVPFVMSEVKAEPAAAVTVLSAPMPFTVTSLLLLSPVVASVVAVLAKEPEMVPEPVKAELVLS